MTDYNGWTNYETWCVKLWMDNDEYTYNDWNDRAREAWDAADHDHDEARTRLADMLRDYWDRESDERLAELGGQVPNSCYADLLNAALSEVDWHEIADSLLEDNQPEAEATEADDDTVTP